MYLTITEQITKLLFSFHLGEITLDELSNNLLNINQWDKSTVPYLYDDWIRWVKEKIQLFREGNECILSLTSKQSILNDQLSEWDKYYL